MDDDPILSPEEAPEPKFSFFQVATTAIVVLMAATTAISWYFIRKKQVGEQSIKPKVAVEQTQEEIDRITLLEQRLTRLEEKIEGIQIKGETSPPLPPLPNIQIQKPAKNGESSRAQIEEANRSFSAGKYNDAENGYFRALFLYPDQPDAYVGLALCALVRGAYTEAWSFLVRILQKNPNFLKEARSPLLYFGSDEEYRTFLGQLESHLMENPLDPDAKLLKAWIDIYEKGGNYGKASATELPGNPEAELLIDQIDSSGK
ncbi:MAG: tetratricopeptide repeat protein [Planctomycetota bacterium]|nr:tetratricopeptide repeat protein [Planctomycetota bacterium]